MLFIMGKLAGGLSFGTFSLAIKEKILAHEGRKTYINSRNIINKERLPHEAQIAKMESCR
ncbi:MAG: hypothetical protein U9N50_07160 [Pseudomonadota bacterium]|nr:hypothetical protein [Pseudomonadota bacterium]